MYCKKCGRRVYSNDNFCSTCGTKLVTPLYQLRAEERGAKAQIKNIPEFKSVEFGKILLDYCWYVASRRYHPNECKYTIYARDIPEYVFDEVKVTQEYAIDLFKYLAKCTEVFFQLRNGFTFMDIK